MQNKDVVSIATGQSITAATPFEPKEENHEHRLCIVWLAFTSTPSGKTIALSMEVLLGFTWIPVGTSIPVFTGDGSSPVIAVPLGSQVPQLFGATVPPGFKIQSSTAYAPLTLRWRLKLTPSDATPWLTDIAYQYLAS